MKRILVLTWFTFAALAVAAIIRGPGQIIDLAGVRYADNYDYLAVVNGDTVYVRADFAECRVGDTLEVEWLPQGDADLAGYNLMLIGSQLRMEEWLPMEVVEIDTSVHAVKKLWVQPGIYYMGVDAQDSSGNRSNMSVAVVLSVKPIGLMPPRRVKIMLGGSR